MVGSSIIGTLYKKKWKKAVYNKHGEWSIFYIQHKIQEYLSDNRNQTKDHKSSFTRIFIIHKGEVRQSNNQSRKQWCLMQTNNQSPGSGRQREADGQQHWRRIQKSNHAMQAKVK